MPATVNATDDVVIDRGTIRERYRRVTEIVDVPPLAYAAYYPACREPQRATEAKAPVPWLAIVVVGALALIILGLIFSGRAIQIPTVFQPETQLSEEHKYDLEKAKVTSATEIRTKEIEADLDRAKDNNLREMVTTATRNGSPMVAKDPVKEIVYGRRLGSLDTTGSGRGAVTTGDIPTGKGGVEHRVTQILGWNKEGKFDFLDETGRKRWGSRPHEIGEVFIDQPDGRLFWPSR